MVDLMAIPFKFYPLFLLALLMAFISIIYGQKIVDRHEAIDPRDKAHDASIGTLSFPDSLNQIIGDFFNPNTVPATPNEKGKQDAFPWTTANTSVWLSAASYCNSDTLLTRQYTGYAEGFIPTKVLYTELYDVQGLIGYLPSQNSIYVAFRGSSSIDDWIDNFHARLVPYPICPGCEVHKGFYLAEQLVLPQVTQAVKDLLVQHPSFQIVVTGHSLGAALATLTAIDLTSHANNLIRRQSQTQQTRSANRLSAPVIVLMNFGSPRIGNLAFAAFASELLKPLRYRVTHLRDTVPHLPWFDGYTHIDGEWYEDELHQLHQCVGYEDINCADQWYVTSIDDHMLYLNQTVTCEAVTMRRAYYSD